MNQMQYLINWCNSKQLKSKDLSKIMEISEKKLLLYMNLKNEPTKEFWLKASQLTGKRFFNRRIKSIIPEYVAPTLVERGNTIISYKRFKKYGEAALIEEIENECGLKVGIEVIDHTDDFKGDRNAAYTVVITAI